jgi:NAD(P)-dependent dehydrogenase (short-subunit alcohol dehydrogenase family)
MCEEQSCAGRCAREPDPGDRLADGLGRAAADFLLSAKHDVVVQARNHESAAGLDALVDRGAPSWWAISPTVRPYGVSPPS